LRSRYIGEMAPATVARRSAHYRLARTRAAQQAHLTTSMAMPRTCLDTADAIELAETLQLIVN
jgi:hypothetical protein